MGTLLQRVRSLAGILAETGVAEIEVAEGTLRIRVVAAPGTSAPVAVLATAAAASAPEPDLGPAHLTVPAPDLVIPAPMHGTFHRAPGPGAPPFVELGTFVVAGQVVGILEAMKVFTPVLATEPGLVLGFGAENGADVAAGQVLLTLQPPE